MINGSELILALLKECDARVQSKANQILNGTLRDVLADVGRGYIEGIKEMAQILLSVDRDAKGALLKEYEQRHGSLGASLKEGLADRKDMNKVDSDEVGA